ncbi:MAG: dihydroneopterin aldolase [Prevotella sp.]|nr:dihydroneopterin aldolase [Prevotella sp.]
MRVKESYISLRDMRFHAYHGVMPQEREVGADFLVSLRAKVDVSAAFDHDMVEVTLNYADLYEVVKFEMLHPSMLIEHVACRIGQAVFEAFPQVCELELSVTKVNPPMGADCAGASVELYLINDKTVK